MDQKIDKAKQVAVESGKTPVTRADVVGMMVKGMGIVVYPDKRLRIECETVKPDEFDDNLKMLAEAMSNVMMGHGGIGISAPQVGIPLRLLIVNLTRKPEDNIAVVNPRIIEASEEMVTEAEGCLSFPNVSVKVTRPVRVTIEAESFEGKTIKLELKGLGSRVVQHEMDHLDGKLLIDYETGRKREMIVKKMKKFKTRFARNNSEGKVSNRKAGKKPTKGPKIPKRKQKRKKSKAR